MTDPITSRTHSAISGGPSSIHSDDDQIDMIWDLLDRVKPLKDLNEWPGISAVTLRKKLIPSYDPSSGSMYIGFAYFLSKGPRTYSITHRADSAADHMNESNFPKFPQTWVKIVHSFLVIYTICSRPFDGQNLNRMNAILKNVEGYYLFDDIPELNDSGAREKPMLDITYKSGAHQPDSRSQAHPPRLNIRDL